MPGRRTRGDLGEITKHEYYKLLPPQLENESDLDYLLFSYYAFLGFQRTLRRMTPILERLNNEEIVVFRQDCISNEIRKRADKFQWTNRARVFDCSKVVDEIDKLIRVDEAIETEWVNKRRESREILQKALTTANKAVDAFGILTDDTIGRLSDRSHQITAIESEKLSRTLLNCANGLEKSVGLVRLVWEQKENIDALETGRQILETALLSSK
jgi:hypothetical protein